MIFTKRIKNGSKILKLKFLKKSKKKLNSNKENYLNAENLYLKNKWSKILQGKKIKILLMHLILKDQYQDGQKDFTVILKKSSHKIWSKILDQKLTKKAKS